MRFSSFTTWVPLSRIASLPTSKHQIPLRFITSPQILKLRPFSATMMAADARKLPPWTPPKKQPDVQLPPLKVYNSLTKKKDSFVPIDSTGRAVTWYACGPTVYEDAHLGHAKNYVCTDIIRRIMVDYFGFNVKFVMNITDIDDKIIVQSRRQYLLERYKQEHAAEDNSVSDSVLAETRSAFQHYIGKNLVSVPPDTKPENFSEAVSKAYKERLEAPKLANPATPEQETSVSEADLLLGLQIATVQSAVEALQTPTKLSEFFAKTDDIMLPYLDAMHCAEIDSDNHDISLRLSQRFERRFLEDMDALNVLRPDRLTRVTEYIPEIVSFAAKIVENGFGYPTSDGSVYFDIEAFERAGHSYCRLEPWNKNDRTLQADGEGSLSKGKSMKRGENHFALWKASKPGEPAWQSPWGRGRPGWHIECSAMASDVIGKAMDIHSGGIDLKFPHHDNELAQSEAYWSTPDCKVQWTNYFLHMGQLRIRGLKMSKSLKNFTTIRAALARNEWTARSLRICFLLMPWQDGVEVTDELLKAVVAWEAKLNNFLIKSLDVWKHRGSQTYTVEEHNAADQQLLNSLDKSKIDVNEALCDSFNTSAVMRILSDLVTQANTMERLSEQTIISLALWITRIVTIFGLDPEGDLSNQDRIGWAGIDIPEQAKPYVYPASELRDSVRGLATTGSINHTGIAKLADEFAIAKSTQVAESSKPYHQVLGQFSSDIKALAVEQASAKDLLALCDQLRDVHLWNLGIYLEDRSNNLPALVRPLDKSLIEARAEKESAAIAKAKAKLEKQQKELEREQELNERAKIQPGLMFKKQDEYSAWDDNGVPTADVAGNELSKNKRKKLLKDWEKQKQIHDEWLAKQ